VLAAAGPLPGVGARDGRVLIDGTAPPWSAVARLQVPGVSRCTAILVGPTTALTAAHCLWGKRLGHFVPPGSVHVLSRYAGGDFARHSVAASYRIIPGFDPARPDTDRATDVAVVTLAQSLGGDVLALAGAATPAGTGAMLGGYNQDRAEVIEADTSCHVIAASARLLAHDCAATHGTSGGPLLVRDAGGAWRVAGLQVAGFLGRSGGVAVAAPVLQTALDHDGGPP
jgi:protease YdgD